MSIEILETQHIARVSGMPALAIAFSPASGSFLPDFIKVTVEHDQLSVLVSGPTLNPRTGAPYKTKRGMTGWGKEDFLEENADERDAPPQWVADFIKLLGYIPVRNAL
jgi:hypothetical protein